MTDRIQCIHADAVGFEGYGDYNVFFLANPFSDIIMGEAADKLIKVAEKNPIIIIYHNPVYMNIFEQRGEVTILKKLYDKRKDYNTYIFRWVKAGNIG